MKTLAMLLVTWGPAALVGWLALAHPAEVSAAVTAVVRALAGA